MGVDLKHIATFILGAAAGAAAYKYSGMSDEEKEQFVTKLKEKTGSLKTEAEQVMHKGKDYFDELSTKGGDALKEHFPGAEDFLRNLFGKSDTTVDPKDS